MSPYTPFRTRRGIHHFLPIRILEAIWFFFVKSSWGLKIVIVGIICIILGLFFPWIDIGLESSIGAFSFLCGGIGWWVSILLVVLLVHVFSYDLTQKIQKTWNMNFGSDHIYVRFGALIIVITMIVSICLIGAARSINSEIHLTTHTSGLVFMIMGGIFLCLGGVVVRRMESKNSYKHVFVQGIENNEDQDSYKKILGDSSDEENMKLPI